jgi:hypothetical protein
MGPLGLVFNLEAMKTIADLPSQEYVGEGFLRTMSDIDAHVLVTDASAWGWGAISEHHRRGVRCRRDSREGSCSSLAPSMRRPR